MTEWTVGIDIGGTKIEVIVVDSAGRLQGRWRRPTVVQSPAALLDAVTTAVGKALSHANITPANVAALGVGVPGQVDPTSGEVRLAVNLDLHDYPLGPQLQARLGWPVVVENDIRLAALGAYKRQAPPRPRHFAYVGVGTGVAAGVILDGRLHRGTHGLAGEIGHMIVEPDGELCNCGSRGCLESIISGPAILRLARAAWPAGEAPPADVAAVFAAAESGHIGARPVVDHAARHLARALYWLVLTYDVETIVLGGGVLQSSSTFLEAIVAEIARQGEQSPLAALLLNHDKIQTLPAGFNAGAWGAVWLARSQEAYQEVPMK